MTISSGIKFHVAAEDSVLYPALIASGDAAPSRWHASPGRDDRHRRAFKAFVLTWRVESRIAAEPTDFASRPTRCSAPSTNDCSARTTSCTRQPNASDQTPEA
ncbi:MAG TPA: hypothetical protein VLZ76_02755, partial [Lysobacter sp.]|nr:hypothetical protein [Lysobacter sp.]